MRIVFQVHPPTRKKLRDLGFQTQLATHSKILLRDPLVYDDLLVITSQIKVIVADSGGLQEESTALGVRCLAMRENAERLATFDDGTSTLWCEGPAAIERCLNEVITGAYKSGKCPQTLGGVAAVGIARVLVNALSA